MGNAYTTSQKVLDEVFDDVPATAQAKIPTWIEDASRKIDAALPNYETPFSSITDATPTPPVIEEAARFLVVDRLLRKLGLLRTDENGRAIETYKKDAEKTLEKLRDGDLIIPESQLTQGAKSASVMIGAVSQGASQHFTESEFSKW